MGYKITITKQPIFDKEFNEMISQFGPVPTQEIAIDFHTKDLYDYFKAMTQQTYKELFTRSYIYHEQLLSYLEKKGIEIPEGEEITLTEEQQEKIKNILDQADNEVIDYRLNK